MLDYLERFPAGADRLRVRLASLLIKTRHRPRRALRILEEVNPAHLNRQYEQERQRVIATANRMIEEGVLELQQQ